MTLAGLKTNIATYATMTQQDLILRHQIFSDIRQLLLGTNPSENADAKELHQYIHEIWRNAKPENDIIILSNIQDFKRILEASISLTN